MDKFLAQFSTIPIEFVRDFYAITKEERETDIIIEFDVVCNWLNIRKDHLKKILIDNFEEHYDYTKKRKKKSHAHGGTTYEKIKITPDCFKELCMISNSPKAKEVRKYFIELEKLIKRYYETIKEAMYKKIGYLETNQKPKYNIDSGVIYIILANNTEDTLYKIGKTKDLDKRLDNYNIGNANNLEPLFIIPVNDITAVENCIKALCKQYQYRKYKEVYEIDLDLLKKAIVGCTELSNHICSFFDEKCIKDSSKKLKRMSSSDNRYYMYFKQKEKIIDTSSE